MKSWNKHGMSGTPTYNSWASMLIRCYNENAWNYYKYGGKNIKVCDRWRHSFINFYEDMGIRPEGKTLDRIKGTLNYSPDNCRWADKYTQSRNRINVIARPYRDLIINKLLGYGETAVSISKILGVKRQTTYYIVYRNKLLLKDTKN